MTSTAQNRFQEFYRAFQGTDLWTAMVNTHENSPFHREENVAVHTQMTIEWYKKVLLAHRTERQQMLTLVGCLMHDTGKPPAEVIKESAERGIYRAYHGHEQLSARLWVDYAMSNMGLIVDLTGFTLEDISNVAMMIEYHVPFGLKDKQKRAYLKKAFIERMDVDGHTAWLDMLRSDQNGRISDDQDKKLADVAVWLNEWEKM